MTIQQAIDRISETRSPGDDVLFYIRTINDMEWRIKREIINACEGREAFRFSGYTFEDLHRELIAPQPYDEIYVWACIYRLDQRENQIANMNNSQKMVDELFSGLSRYWIRRHRPLKRTRMRSAIYEV